MAETQVTSSQEEVNQVQEWFHDEISSLKRTQKGKNEVSNTEAEEVPNTEETQFQTSTPLEEKKQVKKWQKPEVSSENQRRKKVRIYQ